MDTAPTGEAEHTARIKELNDRLRIYGIGGEVYLTRGVALRGDTFVALACRAIADFEGFSNGNDPYEEHDFGMVTVDDTRLFFKIDYYDRNKRCRSEDPADPEKTCRVMTILLAEEY